MAHDVINQGFEARAEQFREMSEALRRWAIGVRGDIARQLDDATYVCECCGTHRYRNFTQKQLRDRVVGVAERMEEIAGVLERRARDPDFHNGVAQPSVKPVVDQTLTVALSSQ